MSKLYNHETKQWEIVPEDQIDQLVLDDTHTFESGIKIPAVAPTGELMDINSDDAHAAFKDGFRWATQADKDRSNEQRLFESKQQAYDDSNLAATGLGVARGLTMGQYY
jgi:hypothetical protein